MGGGEVHHFHRVSGAMDGETDDVQEASQSPRRAPGSLTLASIYLGCYTVCKNSIRTKPMKGAILWHSVTVFIYLARTMQ